MHWLLPASSYYFGVTAALRTRLQQAAHGMQVETTVLMDFRVQGEGGHLVQFLFLHKPIRQDRSFTKIVAVSVGYLK